MANPWLPDLRVDVHEHQRWIIMRRSTIAIACNLGTETVEVPLTGEPLAEWGDPKVGADATTLPPHSVAVLRTG